MYNILVVPIYNNYKNNSTVRKLTLERAIFPVSMRILVRIEIENSLVTLIF